MTLENKKVSNGYKLDLVMYFFLVFLCISLFSRLILTIKSMNFIGFDLSLISNIFFRGVVFDIASAFNFMLPLVIYLSVIPCWICKNRYHGYFMGIVFFSYINILVFNSFSEIIFWEEFGKRFNFIAVDYLVYTHEVINNIMESYPMTLIFSLVFIISLFIMIVIEKKTNLFSKFQNNKNYSGFYPIALVYVFILILMFYGMDQRSFSIFSDNQYANELSKNGIYSLFSAFRNNTLDYNEFYKTSDIKSVMKRINELRGFNDIKSKKIVNRGEEKKYNVMLVMLESMSAEFMGVFGDTNNQTPNLDKLADKSLFFEKAYATGTRTVRGMEAVTLSMVPTPGRSIVKRPDNHNMYSSGFLFKERGYENKFIYAGYGYFDNMNDFFSHNGFSIIDRSDMKDEEVSFANAWGVCDEDLYNKCLS